MKSAKPANYTQIDHESQIVEDQDVIILTSPEAYEKFAWSREFFPKKPEEGYFIWAKNSLINPIITNILICSQYVTQNAINLVIVEENVEAKMRNTCATQRGNLFGKHEGYTKVIVKENAKFEISHFQSWGKDDTVSSSTELILKKGAEVTYSQKCQRVPMSLKMENHNYLEERAALNFATTVFAEQGKIEMYDDTYLNGKKANGISRVKMIAKDNTQLHAQSRMFANEAGAGHLDCMGLLLGDEAKIIAIPELINSNKNASLTHEASVGKISDEILNYLRSRGLTEDEAIDLVITGFIGEEEKIVVDGIALSSKEYM